MTILHAQWQDERIEPLELSMLSPMDIHRDGRWEWRDLPRIEADGLWYPICCYWITEDMWYKSFYDKMHQNVDTREPKILDNGLILAIKMGNNKFLCAEHLGMTHIDGIIFEGKHCINDAVKASVWWRECDPLNNPDAAPYAGTFSY